MPDSNNTGFSIADLKTILNLIQVVSSRGAIKPNEMSAVGDIHDRLAAFLESVDKASAAAQANASTEAGSTISSETKGEQNG